MELHGFDAPYLERLRAGDPATEEEFVSYFGELLCIKLRSRVRTRHQLEDIRQETFLRVFRALRAGTIRDAERLGSFVNSVCNNVLLEHYRSQSRHRPAPDPETTVIEEEGPGPEDELITHERREQVRHVIEDLPERDRRVLKALFLEDRDKDEVTAQLGVDRDYLRVLLHRAKRQFRALYEARQRASAASASVAKFKPGPGRRPSGTVG